MDDASDERSRKPSSVFPLLAENIAELRNAKAGLPLPNFKSPTILSKDWENEKKQFFLSEKCQGAFKSRHFSEAMPLLEQLLRIQTNHWFKLKTQLMISECAIRCDLKQKAESEIKKTRQLVSEIAKSSADDIKQLAQEYEAQGLYIKALILYHCVCDIYSSRLEREAGAGLVESFVKIRTVAEILKRKIDESKSLACEISSDFMINCFEELVMKNGFTNPHEETVCLNNIGITLCIAGKLNDAKSYFQRGVEIMEDKFRQDAPKYTVYGNLFNNLGRVSLNSGFPTEAKMYFMKSTMAWSLAENFPNDAQKQMQIAKISVNLESLTDKLDKL